MDNFIKLGDNGLYGYIPVAGMSRILIWVSC